MLGMGFSVECFGITGASRSFSLARTGPPLDPSPFPLPDLYTYHRSYRSEAIQEKEIDLCPP